MVMFLCVSVVQQCFGHEMIFNTTVIAALCCFFAAPVRAELPLGIAAEAPADGPVIEADGGYMVPYTAKIPGTDVEFAMVPIPGGTFKIGSPTDEADRNDDEGPQVEITVAPFWMSKYELTWAEYKQYMQLEAAFQAFEDKGIRAVTEADSVDAITAPSKLYEPSFTFGIGDDPRQPAVSMTQYAAKQYTKWLSILRGESYRLPTEAEWEYACRAGSSTAYNFGDDPEQLGEHGWYYDNSDDASHLVGEKPANAFGLHDMHGNAAEWTLDAFTSEGYVEWAASDQTSATAIHWPTTVNPRTLRGGSWWHDPEECRSASRIGSKEDDEWKSYDPNTPKSPWWFASDEGQCVGMRIVRVPGEFSAAEKKQFWEADVPRILEIANQRIDKEGRGERGIVDKDLPNAIEQLDKQE